MSSDQSRWILQRGELMSNWIGDSASLHDFLTFSFIYSPSFPHEEHLRPEEQLTLASAFDEIRGGFVFAKRLAGNPAARAAAEELLDRAKAAYVDGDEFLGCKLLQKLQQDLFF